MKVLRSFFAQPAVEMCGELESQRIKTGRRRETEKKSVLCIRNDCCAQYHFTGEQFLLRMVCLLFIC